MPSHPRYGPNRKLSRRGMAAIVGGLLLVAACSSDNKVGSGVPAAQARVAVAQKGVSTAQAAFTDAKTKFCTETADYVSAVDRYGKLFDQSSATVGDVRTLGADLAKPRATTEAAAQAVAAAHSALGTANQALADADAALAAAQASASSAAPPSTTTSTTLPPLPKASIDRVKTAEANLTTASQGITDQTPLVQAAIQYTSAAFALEAAWLNLLNESGCLTDQQAANLTTAVAQYTTSVQTELQTAGYYTGEVDGVYGPTTVDAVKALQTAAGLPVTGLVDRATASALDAAVAQKGGAAAAQATVETAAVQTMLKLGGFWTGPIDGKWTPELTTALMAFQTSVGIQPTGVLDLATLAAVQTAVTTTSTTTTTTASSTTTTVPSSTTTTTSST